MRIDRSAAIAGLIAAVIALAANLRQKRVWVPELGKFVRVRVSARGLKTIDKNGAFKTLKEAGLL